MKRSTGLGADLPGTAGVRGASGAILLCQDCNTPIPPASMSKLMTAYMVAERIRDRIAAHSFLTADRLNVRLTASVGVATLPDVAASAEELIQAADRAMYKVKGSGKNGIEVAAD